MPRNHAYDELTVSDRAEIEQFEADETSWFAQWQQDNPAEAAALREANAACFARVDAARDRLYVTGALSPELAHINQAGAPDELR